LLCTLPFSITSGRLSTPFSSLYSPPPIRVATAVSSLSCDLNQDSNVHSGPIIPMPVLTSLFSPSSCKARLEDCPGAHALSVIKPHKKTKYRNLPILKTLNAHRP